MYDDTEYARDVARLSRVVGEQLHPQRPSRSDMLLARSSDGARTGGRAADDEFFGLHIAAVLWN